MPKPKIFWTKDLGETTYQEAFNLQKKWREQRIGKKIPDLFLFTSHPPVFTLGKRPCEEDFLSSRNEIALEGIEIAQSNRGGKITYHGPGQIVGYFIVDIRPLKLSIPAFVNRIEEILIRSLAELGIEADRHSEYPGVWLGDKKVAALGLHFDRGVSMHGFALNVNPNLRHYRHIVPCGIQDKTVTSLKAEGKALALEKLKAILLFQIQNVFEIQIQKIEEITCSESAFLPIPTKTRPK